jgi:hypothetical protein
MQQHPAAALRIGAENVIFITVWTSPDGHPPLNEWRTHHTYSTCLSCDNPMRFARAIPQADGLPELQTYDCKECGVAMTEAEDSQLASTAASDRNPIIRTLLNHCLLVSTPELQPFRIWIKQRRADADLKVVASFAWPAASAHA